MAKSVVTSDEKIWLTPMGEMAIVSLLRDCAKATRPGFPIAFRYTEATLFLCR